MASSKVQVSMKNCFKGHCTSLVSLNLSFLVRSKQKQMANLCGWLLKIQPRLRIVISCEDRPAFWHSISSTLETSPWFA